MNQALIRTALETLLSQHVTKQAGPYDGRKPFELLPELVDGAALVKGLRLLLILMEEA